MVLCFRRFVVVLLLTGSAGLVACSSSPTESLAEQDPTSVVAPDEPSAIAESTATAEPASVIAADEPSAIAESAAVEEPTAAPSPAGVDEPAEPLEPIATPAPLRPAGEPQPTTDSSTTSTSAYIVRQVMTASSIEVRWSDSDVGVEYHIHRVVRSTDDEPGVEAMTDANLVHVADGLGRFVDEGVEAGTKYWHGVRVLSAEGALVAHGWHRTAAVDDLEPPAVVDGITAVVNNGEVLISWTTPEENYQLHSYRVLRVVDGEPPEQIAQTWRLDQLSFIDDDPPAAGRVVYQIRALDFHWNLSEPGSVTVDLP